VLTKGTSSEISRKRKTLWRLVRKRNIPNGRSPLVSEVSANVYGQRAVACSAQQVPTTANLDFLDRSHYFFIQVALQLSSRS
jgi:hypothetical protein